MPDRNEKYNKIEVTPELIEKYMRGQLDGKTMHAFEKQALDDPFLAEALEGFSVRDPGQSAHLAALKKRLNEKLEATEKRPEKKTFLIRYRNFQIAAAAVLLLLIGAGIFFYAGERPSVINTVAHNRSPKANLPEKIPSGSSKDTSERLAEIPGKDSDVSQEVAVNIPGKRMPANPAEKRVLVQKKKEVPGTAMGTGTDSEGMFRLPLSPGPESLRQAFVGYQSREIAVNNPSGAINISMEPSHQALDEAVVVGYGTKKQRVLKNAASPVGGITAFRQYVKDSLHYPAEARRENIEGVVKLSFIVMPDSSLEQIKVVSSPGYGCDSEAIRLLCEGPRWIPARGGRPSEQTIRIRFSMPGTEK